MPLFFIIAIGAGAFTVGATAVDVTTDTRLENRARAAQLHQVQTQAYVSLADCQRAAAAQGLSINRCQPAGS
jgi:hypothetical protein